MMHAEREPIGSWPALSVANRSQGAGRTPQHGQESDSKDPDVTLPEEEAWKNRSPLSPQRARVYLIYGGPGLTMRPGMADSKV